MTHVVLLGDSIFDNKAYVGAGPDVVEQLRAALPAGWQATLAAVDGSTIADVARQLSAVPDGATYLVVSTGGNDVLEHEPLLAERAYAVAEVLDKLSKIRAAFEANYVAMLDGVTATKLPAAVCTIYESNFEDAQLRRIANTALTIFNDIITREVFARGLPLIDLRLIFDSPADYADPIEPSARGGEKLARVIADVVTTHDFAKGRSEVYAG
jgi:hypothetical protein